MKKLFILLFIIFSSILLVGCNDQDDYAHTIPPFTKFTHKANSFLDMASYVAFGKLKIYYDLWEFGVPGIDYHGVENPETIFLQATQEEYEYLNDPIKTFEYRTQEILDMGFLTASQQEQFRKFADTFKPHKPSFSIAIAKDVNDQDIVIIHNLGRVRAKLVDEYRAKAYIKFSLETTTSAEIIDAALVASGLDEISLDNLNWEFGGIVIHHFVKFENYTIITMFLVDLKGYVSWFEITV